MARVAQIGAVETSASYNRALAKVHVPAKVNGPADAIGECEPITLSVLKVDMQLSGAANCVGPKCAMWRWHPTARYNSAGDLVQNGAGGITDPIAAMGYCGLAPIQQVAA